MFKFISFFTLALFSPACGMGTTVVDGPVELAPSAVLTSAPQDMREAMLAQYRLTPDRRFQWAIQKIGDISGEDFEVTVGFKEGRWAVKYGETTAAQVDELASFQSLHAALVDWSQKRNKNSISKTSDLSAEIDIELATFSPVQLARVLETAQESWHEERNLPALVAAARAATRLAMQQVDSLEIGDAVAGQAWTLIAMAEANGADLTRDRCMLAKRMAYSNYAIQCSEKLLEADALRAYIKYDAPTLESAAKTGAPESKYLWMLYLAENHDREKWRTWYEEQPAVPEDGLWTLRSGLIFHDFEWTPSFSMMQLWQTIGLFREVTREGPGWQETLGRSAFPFVRWFREKNEFTRGFYVAAVEKTITDFQSDDPGLLFDENAISSFFLSAYYSGLFHEGRHYLEAYGSNPISREFVTQLVNSKAKILEAYVAWYSHLLETQEGQDAIQGMVTDIGRSAVGPLALNRTMTALETKFTVRDPRSSSMIRLWVNRLDSRISHRALLGARVFSLLQNVSLYERLYESLVAEADVDYPTTALWLAERKQEIGAIGLMLHKPHYQKVLTNIAQTMERIQTGTQEETLTFFDILIAEHSDEYWPVHSAVNYLKGKGNILRAKQYVTAWLATHTPEKAHGLDFVLATNDLVGMMIQERAYQTALEYALPVTYSHQGRAMEQAGVILDKLGRTGDADYLFARAFSRYPYAARTMSRYVAFLWRHDRDSEAKAVQSAWIQEYPPSQAAEELGERFAELATELPPERIKVLFRQLADNSYSVVQIGIAAAVARTNPSLGSQLQEMIAATGDVYVQTQLFAYELRKRAEGPDAANAWAVDKKAVLMSKGGGTAYYEGAFDLFWTFADDLTDAQGKLDKAYLASLLTEGDARRDKVKQIFAQPSTDRYELLARYMLGLETEDKIWPLADSPRHRCEVAYAHGIHALSEGNYPLAADWFSAAIETQSNRAGEYYWSIQHLTAWNQKGIMLNGLRNHNEKTGSHPLK